MNNNNNKRVKQSGGQTETEGTKLTLVNSLTSKIYKNPTRARVPSENRSPL